MDIEKVRLENGTELGVSDAEARAIIGDGVLDPSFNASDLTGAANELKSSLDGLIKFKTVSRDITQGAGSDYWSLTIPASITGYTKLITGVNIVYASGGGAGGSCYLRGYVANSDTQITAYVYNTSSSSQSLTLEANVLFIPTTHSL